MVILRVDPLAPDDTLIAEAVAILQRGGVVAYPTDTLYGLAVDPRQEAAVERLYRVKGRDSSVAIPLIAGSLAQAFAAGTFSDADVRLARAFWPGPLSIVVPASRIVPASLVGPGATVAIRVPDHAVARALALALGVVVTATSANRSGSAPASSAAEVAAALSDRIDAIVDAGAAQGGPPSTIVQVRDGVPQLLRAGAIAFERVLESGQ